MLAISIWALTKQSHKAEMTRLWGTDYAGVAINVQFKRCGLDYSFSYYEYYS